MKALLLTASLSLVVSSALGQARSQSSPAAAPAFVVVREHGSTVTRWVQPEVIAGTRSRPYHFAVQGRAPLGWRAPTPQRALAPSVLRELRRAPF